MSRERAIAIGQTLGILILMSLGTVLMKLALGDVSPWTFAAVSVLIGMVFLSLYTFVLRRERIPRGLSRQVWFYIIMIGVCNFAIARFTSTLALERMPATTNSYLTNFIGFITMAMSIFILKESPTLFQVLGAVVAIVGLRVFFVEIPSPSEMLGIVLVAIGITAVAYTNNIARKLAIITHNDLSNNIISTTALLIGGSITVVVGIAMDFPPRIAGITNWGILFYSGIVMIALGLTVWNKILRTLRSYEASILGASTVIWTALLAVPILGETLTPNQMAGIALMIVGLALVQVRRGRFSTIFRRLRPAQDVVPSE